MTELAAALGSVAAHEGVQRVILLGRDGLVVQNVGSGADDDESVAARVPGLVAACAALGAAAGGDSFRTAVLEYEHGVTIVVALSGDLLLAVLLRPGVGFASLLRELRRERDRLIHLL
jgi:predicted regulator of Ras-like GTPase activity (Roadblock/LC7/MglB family)